MGDASGPTQKMATSSRALLDVLAEGSFLTPDEYRERLAEARRQRFVPLGPTPIRQAVDPDTDPYADIDAAFIRERADHLVGVSRRSREHGDLLWGRVQGTRWEREAQDWVAEQLRSFGIDDVRHDHFDVRAPLWTPTANELTVVDAPGRAGQEPFRFGDAVTPFRSAVTPPGGVVAPMIYVGEGSPAELSGRDLTGKLVLLRARGLPGQLFNTARVAYSRLAAGDHGRPAGVVVWWDTPGARQVAGRVGAVGGGDELGLSVPWITIGDDDGYYLRKLIDRSDADHPVQVRLVVEGRLEGGADGRRSSNVYGVLPGRSGKYVVLTAHADSYFYGLHDNGATLAMVLAVARHFAARGVEERAHGLIVLSVGDHEDPGVGATDLFLEQNRAVIENDLLMVLRPEKLGLLRQKDEGFIRATSNAVEPLMLMVTNRSPVIIELFRQAIADYSLRVADFVYQDPAADETNFHPPYADIGAISAGFVQAGIQYHSTADVEHDLVCFQTMEQLGRAHAAIIDGLGPFSIDDLRRDAVDLPAPDESIYQSDVIKLMFGNH